MQLPKAALALLLVPAYLSLTTLAAPVAENGISEPIEELLSLAKAQSTNNAQAGVTSSGGNPSVTASFQSLSYSTVIPSITLSSPPSSYSTMIPSITTSTQPSSAPTANPDDTAEGYAKDHDSNNAEDEKHEAYLFTEEQGG